MSFADPRALRWARFLDCPHSDDLEGELSAQAVAGSEAEEIRAAWHAHRAAVGRLDSRLDARVRDLEALNGLGRTLADARSRDELIDRAVEAIAGLIGADAIACAGLADGVPDVRVYIGRPLAAGDVDRLREAAAHGFVPLPAGGPIARPLAACDPLQGPRPPLREADLVVVPIERRGREVLHVAVLPQAGADERNLRLLFGAASHVALHLDRVLTVAEAEDGRFRAMLDAMPHAVLLTDASFDVVSANAAAEALLPRLGLSAAGAVRSLGDLDVVALAYDLLAGRRAEASGDARFPDGRCLEVALAAWPGRAGLSDGLVVVIHDVTTARRLREQVTQSEKLSGLGRMVAGVAHELNNPLTAVIGYAQLLKTLPPGEKAAARLETVRKEAERCRRIVQNLLRFARPRGPEKRAVSLNEIVENVTLLLAYPVRSARCAIALDLDRGLPAVLADAHELEQALVNLVTNAYQAMTAAGSTGTVTVSTYRRGDDRVGVEVADDGPGIPEPFRTKVFDPFYTTKPEGSGTGLGLWLVYNTVTAHGGAIDVGASPSGGARFRLEFPTSGAVAELSGAAVAPEEIPCTVSAKILVVDAEAALASLICEALEAEGHEAVAASAPEEALGRLAAGAFDLLVSDAELPGLSGDRLAAEAARLRPGSVPRLVLTTGHWDDRETEAAARRLDAALLRKPFELDELRRVVRSRLGPVPES